MYNFRYVRNFFFQAEDGIRDLVRSRGLGDVYKRQHLLFVVSLVLSLSPLQPKVVPSSVKIVSVLILVDLAA